MSIQSEINRLKNNVAAAFTAIGNKGGNVPSSKVSGNLATAIQSIPHGVELNFEVVGGTSQPISPKENTIWVNTSTTISSWVFSATQPSNPSNGMVWISTGTSNTVEFNALKKNGIQVYPISAKQYVSGAWKDVTAKSYRSGQWVDWVPAGALYWDGYEVVPFYGHGPSSGKYKKEADGLVVYSTSTSRIDGCFTTEEPYNTSGYTKLEVTVEVSGSNPVFSFGLLTFKGDISTFNQFAKVTSVAISGTHYLSIDNGNYYYINVNMHQNGNAKVKRIRLVK